jgi:hypothetical protein
VASSLHALTKKDRAFPTGSKWIPGSDYDLAYHHVKSLILDRPLCLWNKNNEEHLFFEVNSSDDGWRACAFQYADKASPGEDEGKHHLRSKKPKRIIAWISNAWTTYEKKSLPIFYKETIARLLTQALQIMKLRNFVTNIMITKFFRETRYQYNDHEGWGGKLVTNIMITNFFS